MVFIKEELPGKYKKILETVEPFNILSADVLKEVIEKLQIRNYPEGSYIFKQGEQSKGCLFIVLNGKVEIIVKGENGEEIKHGERIPYNFFGETAFFTGGNYAGSAKAVEETSCLVIEEDTFEELADVSPEFSQYFQKALGERIKSLYQRFLIEEEGAIAGDQALDDTSLRTPIRGEMVTSVVVCEDNDTGKEIAQIMKDNDVSSVIVIDEENHPLGIITEQDLAHKIVARDFSATEVTAYELSSKPLITLSPENYLYQALILMVKNKIKHLVITENDGTLAGMVTVRDIIKSKKAGALNIAQGIDNAKTIDDLKKPRDEIDNLMAELVRERASAEMICEIISEFYDRLSQKVVRIAEEEMIEEGYGPPPVNYSFISMGSSGRKEQFIRSDQDNGLIFEDPYRQNEKEVQDYFLTLGEKIVSGLVKCGFKECPGNVVASNPTWCRSFKSWRNLVKEWVENPDEESIRFMTIFLDFRHIYGQERYCNLLRNFVVRTMRENIVTLQFLVKDDLKRKPPIGFFKQIKAKKDKKYGEWVNLKKSACVHIVDCLRVFALREGLTETNTYERLNKLQERGALKVDDAEFVRASYEALMMFRIKDSVDKIRQSLPPDNMIALNTLTKWEKTILRESLLAVERLQYLTGVAFHIHT